MLEVWGLKKRIKVAFHIFTSLVAQMVKNPPAMQETQVQSLGWEDPCSSILAWRTPRTKGPGRLQSVELQRVRHN